MRRKKHNKAFSLVELIVAMAIMVLIFSAVVPQFRAIRNSWASTEESSTIIQNAGVLDEHINRNLAAAKQIVSVSSSSVANGFITFKDNLGATKKYMVSSGYVVFGDEGSEEQIAGPVSRFQISCYSINPAVTLTTDANTIRFVNVETDFANDFTQANKTFTTSVYLQTNNQAGGCWSNMDIGSPAVAGSAIASDCQWTINSSGIDIWNYSDQFHYVYQPLSSDGQITARVYSMTNSDYLAKAGVMIRESLAANSKNVMTAVTPGFGIVFQYRPSTGSDSTFTSGSSNTAPRWIKLVRSGDTFTGYESPDGLDWTQIDAVNISMATDVYIGMAVTSHNYWSSCSAVIDNISSSGVMYEGISSPVKTSSGMNLSIPTPAVNENDLLIAAIAAEGSATISPPAGWTIINQGNSSSGQVTLGAWRKIAASSEPASHTFTWSGNRAAYGWMMRFTGHDVANPINGTPVAYDQTSATPQSPAVTTTTNNCIILRLGAFAGGDITIGDPGLHSPVNHTAITMDNIAGVLFEDDFENSLNNWTTDWDKNNTEHSGNHSVHCGSSQNDLISNNINTTGLGSIRIEFWYMDDDIDNNDDVYLQFYDGSTYDNKFELGNSTEDVWNKYDITISNSGGDTQYFRNNFQIKIEGTSIDSGENLWIDDVIISSGGVSGGAGYIKQSTAGSSGTSNFSLGSANEARSLTVAIKPADSGRCDCGSGGQIEP